MQRIVFAADFFREQHDVFILGSQHQPVPFERAEVFRFRQTCANAANGRGTVGDVIRIPDLGYSRIFNSPSFQGILREQGRLRINVEMNAILASCNAEMGKGCKHDHPSVHRHKARIGEIVTRIGILITLHDHLGTRFV
ncbi:hypothetical protein D3C81_1633990 [compost metagenome]